MPGRVKNALLVGVAVSVIALFGSGCSRNNRTVVRYLDHTVSADEVVRESETWGPVKDFEEFASRVREIALVKEFSRLGREKGLASTDLTLISNLTRFKEEKLSELYTREVIDPEVNVSDEELEDAVAGRTFEDIVVIRVVLPKDPGSVPEIREEISAGKSFDDILQRYGTETGKRSGGVIGNIARSNDFFPPEERERVYGSGAGEFFGPVRTLIGEIFVKVDESYTADEHRELVKKSLEPQLRAEKFRQAVKNKYEELKAEHDVKVFEENVIQNVGGNLVRVVAKVDEVVIAAPDSGGAGFHGGPTEAGISERISQVLFMIEAETLGLDGNEEYRAAYQAELERELYAAYKRSVHGQEVQVSEAALKEFYEANKEQVFFTYPEASYFVIRGVLDEQLQPVKEKAASIAGKPALEEFAKELNLPYELILRQMLPDIEPELGDILFSHADGDVFDLDRGGKKDVYRVINLEREEEFPSFEKIRSRVREAYVSDQKARRLKDFIAGEIAKMRVDGGLIKKLYEQNVKRSRGG
ncbi:MAG: hypothetical protein GTO00_07125 [Deltaproteobacteria bacterium]|nr:hypothetical protein [Candidatus Latescibacterota bacterium]NIS77374.1 hypothetical protein [Deltaproteobacteria bacterium]